MCDAFQEDPGATHRLGGRAEFAQFSRRDAAVVSHSPPIQRLEADRRARALPGSGTLEESNILTIGVVVGGMFAAISPRGEAMKAKGGVKILFIAGFGPISRDATQSRNLYRDTLGIPFKEDSDGYLYTHALQGAKHFALWPLSQAARSCFGKDSWPDNISVPQAWLELEVDSVQGATAELESRGYRMLIKNKKEPWGQTVSRFISPEGLLVGVTFTPSMREGK